LQEFPPEDAGIHLALWVECGWAIGMEFAHSYRRDRRAGLN